jgi:hypothetical protein
MATQAVSDTDIGDPRLEEARSVAQQARRRLRVPDGVITAELMTRDAKEQRVRDTLNKESHAADLHRALFAASLLSYRRPTICNPFPHEFTSTEGPDFETAVRVQNVKKERLFFFPFRHSHIPSQFGIWHLFFVLQMMRPLGLTPLFASLCRTRWSELFHTRVIWLRIRVRI